MTSPPDATPFRPDAGGSLRIALAVVLLAGAVVPILSCSHGTGDAAEPPPGKADSRPVAAGRPAPRVFRQPEVRAGDIIYAVAGADDRFLAIDPKTASVRTVGNLGMKIGGMEDLALAPDGTMIASYWEGYPALLRINTKTGRATPGPRIRGGR